MTTKCVRIQRKNAANKLQHSGLATVVVYHIRHRVVHHIDMRNEARDLIPLKPAKQQSQGLASALERGPDFAEAACIQSSTLPDAARATWVTRRAVSLC
jgi:hypothetical protein